jgi:predicted nucleic acid-binding protein
VILVDSSSWIHFLRPTGDPVVRARVEAALTAGEACWCPLVRLELWNGAAGDRDRRILRDFESVLPELAIDDVVWVRAYELARRARATGVFVPATDILIAACAGRHGAELETADSDFDQLAAVPPIETQAP